MGPWDAFCDSVKRLHFYWQQNGQEEILWKYNIWIKAWRKCGRKPCRCPAVPWCVRSGVRAAGGAWAREEELRWMQRYRVLRPSKSLETWPLEEQKRAARPFRVQKSQRWKKRAQSSTLVEGPKFPPPKLFLGNTDFKLFIKKEPLTLLPCLPKRFSETCSRKES